jgi:hypothetical protein
MATENNTPADPRHREFDHPQVQNAWVALDCGFAQVADVFEECVSEGLARFNMKQLDAYIEAARVIGKLGRGAEPLLAFLEEWPAVAGSVSGDQEALLPQVMAAIRAMQKSPNSASITPFLQTLAAVARRLKSAEQLQIYIEIALNLMVRTSGSIHGHHITFPSSGLPFFFEQAPRLLGLLSLAGLKNWTDYGIRNYAHHPERQAEFFRIDSADSRAVLQRERHGTLFYNVERSLDLYLRALWQENEQLVPYSTLFDNGRQAMPYYDHFGMRIPDVMDDDRGVSGLDHYRAVLAHMAGHRRWSSQQVADNWSPFQRMAVEFFEDARIETLLCREYPGLRRIFLALHPTPLENACDPETTSCLRHRLCVLSRALLDPAHDYSDPTLKIFVDRFHALLAEGESSTGEIAELALSYVAKTRRQSDQLAKVHFENTVVDYRDDNRHLWRFIEEDDEGEFISDEPKTNENEEIVSLPPRHYPEWDFQSQTYRPDWVSLYEALHKSGKASDIDKLLLKHAALAKQLKRLLEMLKPQDKVRIRYQEEGSELDLDIALRSLIDLKSGNTPDPRINMSHRTDGRDISVLLLIDLSQSLNETLPGGNQSILETAREAVALLGWAIGQLGDACAIAGFHSNSRHEVRYHHIKGFSEPWDDPVKARLAAVEAGWSTRMGAAIRHAGQMLSARKTEKRILLVLTDGEPADIDVSDPQHLIHDTKKAVQELSTAGVTSFCLSLDPKADAYVGDIFGRHWRVLDHIARLPEQLPMIYLNLTR